MNDKLPNLEQTDNSQNVPREKEVALNFITSKTNGKTAENAANIFEDNLNLTRGVPSAGGRKGPPWNIPTMSA